MVVVRCTERLRKRLKRGDESGQSTTALGDWYGNLIRFGTRQVLLFVSERSRLPILLPAIEAKNLDRVLPVAVGNMLDLIGIEQDAIAREVAAMTPVAVSRTANRSVVGTMTDFAFMAEWDVAREPGISLYDLTIRLAISPILPLGGGSSIMHTRAILGPRRGLTTNEFQDPDGRWRI